MYPATSAEQARYIRTFAKAYCSAKDDPEAADRFRIEEANGAVTFSTIDAALCGASISGFLRPKTWKSVVTQSLNRIMRQRARTAAIARTGETGSPAWSMDVNALAMVILANAGIMPGLLATHPSNRPDRRSYLEDALDASPVRIEPEMLAGRVCLRTISVRDGSGIDPGIVYCEPSGLIEHPGPTLMVLGRELPQTSLIAMIGRPLFELIRHPLLDNMHDIVVDITIQGLRNDDGNLMVEIDDHRVRLAPSPPGVVADWLRFDWYG